MEQLTATVKQNADNAHHASKLAQDASGKATTGGQIVSGVVTTMGNISSSSKKISEITAVINSIAFPWGKKEKKKNKSARVGVRRRERPHPAAGHGGRRDGGQDSPRSFHHAPPAA
ncbi:Methyl-accepting chemotaxis protein III (ribose and galactose chemoreceptor protein) [Cronobacter universalis NCTC 9529]|nr:Methyl-accepting chemotaxis protein III (ribose and galactose chemoreceptor protein) [Cronobacter universalis NCTC 9529]